MKLIDKDALVAEIERRINEYNTPVDRLGSNNIRLHECKDLFSFLNNLEEKDVNLEKELDEWMRYGPHTNYPWCTIPDAIKITAEHFFELGLKAAQKGE